MFDWTHSLFKAYPYQAVDGRENETESGDRVVRGGAAYSVPNMSRCAYRVTNKPDHAYISRGFRLCISPIYF